MVVVPRVAENHPDFMEKPIASTELLRKVRNYLADRKLLTTVLNVTRLAFRELSVVVEIILLQATAADRVKAEIQRKVRMFLHPLRGGKGRDGWPFGRPVYRVDLYHVVEDVSGVDFVDRFASSTSGPSLRSISSRSGPANLFIVCGSRSSRRRTSASSKTALRAAVPLARRCDGVFPARCKGD